jgi:hypothetical protein
MGFSAFLRTSSPAPTPAPAPAPSARSGFSAFLRGAPASHPEPTPAPSPASTASARGFSAFLGKRTSTPTESPVDQMPWEDRMRRLRQGAEPAPKEPTFGYGTTPAETSPVSVVIRGNKKKSVRAWPTGVQGLVITPMIGENDAPSSRHLTVTHAPSGFSFASGLDMEVGDAIRAVQAFAAMHPSLDFTLPADALVQKVRDLGKADSITKDFDDLASQQATYPSVAARKQAMRAYQQANKAFYGGANITADDILRAFNAPGRVDATKFDFIDIYGFRYHFGWSGDRLVPRVDYAHQKQGEHYSKRVLWTPEIEEALGRFLARVTDARHRSAEAKGLPRFYAMRRFVDAPAELTAAQIQQVKDARVMSDDGRTRESGKQAVQLDGRSWVATGYSFMGDELRTTLYEVVPESEWNGRIYSFKDLNSARDIGVDGSRPVPGIEVFLKGRRFVYTGRSKQISGPDRVSRKGSSARRGITFPMFEGQV